MIAGEERQRRIEQIEKWMLAGDLMLKVKLHRQAKALWGQSFYYTDELTKEAHRRILHRLNHPR
jgi:hypothetical protein